MSTTAAASQPVCVPTAAAAQPACALKCEAEQTAYASAAEASLLAVASLQAPPAPVDASRAPLELVAVLDRSGSMQGQKITLMKQTINLLVTRSGLQAQDKLGIVVFDDKVQIALPLTSMDQAGLRAAKLAIDAVCVGGTTNLSGGLMQGLQMLCQSDEAAREQADDAADGEAAVVVGGEGGATRSLLLFTDGQANAGIIDGGEMVAAAQALLKDHPALAIFTFGYGDHDENTLRGLAEASRGLFYFIEQPDAIPAAFADCLGGLASVVCQNATLELCVAGGRRATAKIAQLLDMTTYQVSAADDGSKVTLSLGDLYADDEKDMLLRLSLAALVAPRDAPETVLEAALCYYSVSAKRFERVEAHLVLARPAAPPVGAAPNLKLDEQRNRMEAAEAIEKATALADKGDREGGEALLAAAVAKLGVSASSRTPTSRGLQDDLQRLALDYQDAHTYITSGSKRSKSSALSHRQQRDATSWDTFSAAPSNLTYKSAKGGKGAMSRAWTIS
eukprot:scaffold500_cov74-Phaeocystis_antarctica.AAC.1